MILNHLTDIIAFKLKIYMETKQLEITQIIKRDYETSPFVLNKISNAVEKAMLSVGNGSKEDAKLITANVLETLLERKSRDHKYLPTVEEVQDLVELKLMNSTFQDVAKAYILYRDEQTRNRKTNIFEKRINLALRISSA